ncbi:hypothetical protein BAUCODRAFT_462989 [Baudoinia panamericana UAMH 10762]|uniref:Trafficking protein particle complex subunit 6B n=1 Tax=Baudoinia panamericana (strain UAMH 10762) TaxID=717646 RepID=M2LT53_BAUPA|nr:uncharacterized protein BAUCODRAFT_462989 [Baudoinia panamericana UAMH 10762]EMC97697.1 hypothetical protein BAUCODRAFT_462989 [Baudoinia panamericana UAMH 10762]
MSRVPQPQPDEDPLNPKAAASALDFLLIELVPLAQRVTEQVNARHKALREQYERTRTSIRTTASTPINQDEQQGANAENGAIGREAKRSVDDQEPALTSLGFPVMTEQTREGVFWRLDGMGYRVGQGLVERFSVNKPRPTNELDAIKFICKDLWILVFRKQIDNLKTNHRGIFVLTDNKFQPLSKMSIDRRAGNKAAEETAARAQTYLYYPCGVIRGALSGFGMEVTVEGSTTEIPSATFQIKTKGAKP